MTLSPSGFEVVLTDGTKKALPYLLHTDLRLVNEVETLRNLISSLEVSEPNAWVLFWTQTTAHLGLNAAPETEGFEEGRPGASYVKTAFLHNFGSWAWEPKECREDKPWKTQTATVPAG